MQRTSFHVVASPDGTGFAVQRHQTPDTSKPATTLFTFEDEGPLEYSTAQGIADSLNSVEVRKRIPQIPPSRATLPAFDEKVLDDVNPRFKRDPGTRDEEGVPVPVAKPERRTKAKPSKQVTTLHDVPDRDRPRVQALTGVTGWAVVAKLPDGTETVVCEGCATEKLARGYRRRARKEYAGVGARFRMFEVV